MMVWIADLRLRKTCVRVEMSLVSAVGMCEISVSPIPIVSKMSWSALFQMSLLTGHWILCVVVFSALVPHLVQVVVVLPPSVCSFGSAWFKISSRNLMLELDGFFHMCFIVSSTALQSFLTSSPLLILCDQVFIWFSSRVFLRAFRMSPCTGLSFWVTSPVADTVDSVSVR